MALNPVIESGTEYTTPENRGICGFCGKEENGYAKRDENGKWQPACWPCVKPKGPRPPTEKRLVVGTVYTDTDAEEPEAKKKNLGMAPSSHRPKVL